MIQLASPQVIPRAVVCSRLRDSMQREDWTNNLQLTISLILDMSDIVNSLFKANTSRKFDVSRMK